MWWWKKRSEVEGSREAEEMDYAYTYEEPERGEFDHPHRIRSVEQMLVDDQANPITADAFLAYRQLLGEQARARSEFDLSVWEHVPDYDEDGKPYKGTVVPDEPKPPARKRTRSK